jgi:hypothetical protein
MKLTARERLVEGCLAAWHVLMQSNDVTVPNLAVVDVGPASASYCGVHVFVILVVG